MSRTKAKLIKLAQDMEYFYPVLATELIYKYKTIHKGVLLETLEEYMRNLFTDRMLYYQAKLG